MLDRKRYAINRHVLKVNRRISRQQGTSEPVQKFVERATIEQIMSIHGLDAEKEESFEIYPPRERKDIEDLAKYQIVLC